MTTHATVGGSGEIRSQVPLLAEATPHIGHFQIRNRGTIGGSLSHADPGAEYPAVALALDAGIVLASTRGTRTVAAREFFTGTFTTVAEPDEVLTEVRFTGRPQGCAVLELARRHGDFALAGVACAVELDSAERIQGLRIALFGVASTPVRATAAEQAARGAAASELDPEEVGRAALAGVSCVSDLHADASYRERVAAHLASQAVRQALQRALEEARNG
jgi:carbon-monoxide dehydrogenase medium subunit